MLLLGIRTLCVISAPQKLDPQHYLNAIIILVYAMGEYIALSPGSAHFNVGCFPSVNGTTGESLNLTTEERKLAAEEWIKQAKGK